MATVIASPARPGPNGGFQGGTAVFLPPRISCLASSILIPACVQCAECRINTFNVDFTVVVVYLPPDSRLEVLSALLAFTSFSSPVFVTGDFNFDLFAPRDDEERLLSSQLNDLMRAVGSALLPLSEPAHRAKGTCATLDGVAVPAGSMWRWTCNTVWRGDISDHAMISVDAPPQPPSSARACTPQALAALPQEAHDDLRHRFRCLDVEFHIPDLGHVTANISPPACQTPGVVPDGDPLLYDSTGAPFPSSPDPPTDTPTSLIPWNPTLARWGYLCMNSTVNDWWRIWSVRPTETDMRQSYTPFVVATSLHLLPLPSASGLNPGLATSSLT